MESNLLVFDVGSTYTKLSAFSMQDGELTYLGRSQSPTTISNIGDGWSKAEKLLREKGITLADKENTTILSSSSAAGGLRMVALGFMPRVTAKAAKEVAMGAGARVLEVISHEEPKDYRIQVLREIRPDLILLAGGTDGGDEESMLNNAETVVESGVDAVVVIAGNVNIQSKTKDILENGGFTCVRVPNIMPNIHTLKLDAAREAIHECFIKQITQAQGLNSLLDIVSDGKVVPTPGAVLLGAELLAKGTYSEDGVGDILILDLGGATTDIHSVLPGMESLSIEEIGLVVTNEKQTTYRTVEGNLGMRVSATGIVETVGPQAVLAKVGRSGAEDEKAIVEYTRFLEKHTDHIASDEREKDFDKALAITAIEVALKRHAGYISQEYNALTGVIPGTPVGRDLRHVKCVIAVGGMFTYATPEDRQFILEQVFKDPGISLLPVDPQFRVDDQYLLYAVGVLSRYYKDAAFRFAKKHFKFDEE